jgi:hypothetical protein
VEGRRAAVAVVVSEARTDDGLRDGEHVACCLFVLRAA